MTRPLALAVLSCLAVLVPLVSSSATVNGGGGVDVNFSVTGAGLLKTQAGKQMIGMSEQLSLKSTGSFTSQAAGSPQPLDGTWTANAAGVIKANVTAAKRNALILEVPGTIVKKSKQRYAKMAQTSAEVGGIEKLKIVTKNAGVKFKRKGKIFFGWTVDLAG